MAITKRVKGRRGRGEGSVYRDPRTGLWVGIIDLGTVNGKRARRYIRSKDKAVLLEKMKDHQVAPSGSATSNQTVTQWLEYWLTKIVPGTVKASTEAAYANAVKAWIVPHIGHIRLARLAPEDVVDMMRGLEAQGRAPATQRMARTILRLALVQAQLFGQVSRNVVTLTRPPKQSGARLDDTLTAEESLIVLATARGDRLEALAVMALTLGARQGELLALGWPDIDMEAATVRLSGTKTDKVRTVALPPTVIAALTQHRARQRKERLKAEVWQDPDLVFSSPIGTRDRPD